MNPRKFKHVEYKGRHYYLVPELPPTPGQERGKIRGENCHMCAFIQDARSCTELNGQEGGCGAPRPVPRQRGFRSRIYLPEEQAQEYVVELVRRRVSS